MKGQKNYSSNGQVFSYAMAYNESRAERMNATHFKQLYVSHILTHIFFTASMTAHCLAIFFLVAASRFVEIKEVYPKNSKSIPCMHQSQK